MEGLVYNSGMKKPCQDELSEAHVAERRPLAGPASKAVLIGLSVFIISAILALVNPFQVIQWKVTDLFFTPKQVNDQFVIIAIDDKSLSPEAGLGRFRDWPRSYYSQLLRAINPHKPAVVAFDLDFREQSKGMSDLRIKQLLQANSSAEGGVGDWASLLKRFDTSSGGENLTHPDDSDFQKAIDESGWVVFVSSLLFSREEKYIAKDFPKPSGTIMPIFKGQNVATGYNNIMYDRDSVLRRFTPWVLGKGSFQIAVANAFLKKQSLEPDPEISEIIGANPDAENVISAPLLINFYGKPGAYKIISFVDVLAGKFEPSDIAGKIVLVGATAGSLQDLSPTPTSREFMPGVEIHANIIQQILENKFIKEQGTFGAIFVLLIFAVVGTILFLKLSLRNLLIVFGAVIVLWPVLAYASYKSGFIINIIYPEITWILLCVAILWYRNETELKAKREIKKAFSHYVSPVVVNELAKNPEMLRLGGRREKISVMFSDIVGFTTFSEKLSPEDTVAVLNDYLSSMTDVIFAYNGTLDKYQGDAIMALFGAPLEDDHHAVNACSAALSMRKALANLHEKWNAIPELPYKDEILNLDFRVGIATGGAVVGNVGSEKRFDYTAIGDIVNLGSRLESINRKYGTKVIVNKETFTTITENHNPFLFRKLDTVRVKGKKQATEIFELVTIAETATAEIKSMLDDFENGRILYAERNFAEAKKLFESALGKIPGDGPSQIYKNRCDFYIRKPPSLDWNAVVDLMEK